MPAGEGPEHGRGGWAGFVREAAGLAADGDLELLADREGQRRDRVVIVVAEIAEAEFVQYLIPAQDSDRADITVRVLQDEVGDHEGLVARHRRGGVGVVDYSGQGSLLH